MRHKHVDQGVRPVDLLDILGRKLSPSIALILGSRKDWLPLLARLQPAKGDVAAYAMDLYEAEELRAGLNEAGATARVISAPDLWDLPAEFQTAVYAPPGKSERELKIDMVEQAFHILRPHGTLVVVSPHEADSFFSPLLKKFFGKVHAPAAGNGAVFWCQREGDKPRRRHEMTFQVRGREDGCSLRFLSRPGVFSYGRFDHGARALVECAVAQPGDRILDLGCGCGTNGVLAADLAGPGCHVTFVDSNLRALALAEHNARTNGLADFSTVATCRVEGPGLDANAFDVVLANPPYYAFSAIAQLFVRRSSILLRPGGRFYLVTKQPKEVAPMLVEHFGHTDAVMRRGYTILAARRPGGEESPDALFRLETDVV
jgi:23S rRNA (guanine1835-N2)-methyltransferase